MWWPQMMLSKILAWSSAMLKKRYNGSSESTAHYFHTHLLNDYFLRSADRASAHAHPLRITSFLPKPRRRGAVRFNRPKRRRAPWRIRARTRARNWRWQVDDARLALGAGAATNNVYRHTVNTLNSIWQQSLVLTNMWNVLWGRSYLCRLCKIPAHQ